MEHLVYGISNINFEHNKGITKENCAPNQLMPTTIRTFSDPFTFVVEPVADVCEFNCLMPVSTSHFETLAMSSNKATNEPPTSTEEFNLSSSNESEAAEEACSSLSNYCTRRKLPARASKESTILSKTKRRSIIKPTKRGAKSAHDFSSLRPADIKKIYLNKKLTNFHPAKLETIFEEPQSEVSDAESQVHFIGARKLKRSLSFCDGINMNKTLIKQRRLKIKKSFGRRFALKKISLDDFLQRLNKSFDGSAMDEEDQEGQQTETDTKQPSTLEDTDTEEKMEEAQSSAMNNEEETVTELLPTIPDGGGVLIKSNSFSGGCPASQPANQMVVNTNVALR